MSLAEYYDQSYPPSLWGGGEGGPGTSLIITSVVPSTVVVNVATPITVTGQNFTSTTQVWFDGVVQSSAFVSATSITATLTSPTVGMAGLSVYDPEGEGGASETFNITTTATTVTAEQVSGWTIDEVKSFVVAHPELLSEVNEFEEHGRARQGLLEWLQKLLDEEDEPDDAA